jgi:hypothetical protein
MHPANGFFLFCNYTLLLLRKPSQAPFISSSQLFPHCEAQYRTCRPIIQLAKMPMIYVTIKARTLHYGGRKDDPLSAAPCLQYSHDPPHPLSFPNPISGHKQKTGLNAKESRRRASLGRAIIQLMGPLWRHPPAKKSPGTERRHSPMAQWDERAEQRRSSVIH